MRRTVITCIPHGHLHTVPSKPAYPTVTYIQFHPNLHTTRSPTYSSIQTCIPLGHLIQFHPNLHTTRSPTYSSIQTCIPHSHLHTIPSKLAYHTFTYIQFHPNLHTTRSPTYSSIQICIPHSHLHTVTYTRGRTDTIDSTDDKHLVARNL